MGYTHYWRINTAELEPRHFFALAGDAPALFATARGRGIDLVRESDRPNEMPRLAGGLIIFNGLGDLGHETFCLDLSPHRPPAVARPVERDDNELAWADWYNYDNTEGDAGWRHAFCKTAHKPYDAAVCAALMRAKHYLGDALLVSSDGDFDNEDWAEGRALYASVFGVEPVSPLERE